MSNSEDKKPIIPPAPHRERELARGIAEGVADLVPGASIVTNILSVTNPSKSDQEHEAWQNDISERTNDNTSRIDYHDSLLNPQKKISGVAGKLIYHLAKSCPDGLGHKDYELKDMIAMLPEEDAQAVEDAAYELKSYGLIDTVEYLGGEWHANLTPEFYEQIDHQVMGWNTQDDAKLLANKMLELDTGDARELHEATGWERRRFNPAFRSLLPLFPDGRVRKVIQPDYPSMGVVLAPEDKAQLRRFISE